MKGNSPLFCPKNSIASGDINLPSGDKTFFTNAAKRSDIDANGYLDILAHGNASSIRLEINGKELQINWRELAKIIKRIRNFGIKGLDFYHAIPVLPLMVLPKIWQISLGFQ